MKKIVQYAIDGKFEKVVKIQEKMIKLFPKEAASARMVNVEEGSEREKEFLDYVTKKRIKVSQRVDCARITFIPKSTVKSI